jgi:hypothetical protein
MKKFLWVFILSCSFALPAVADHHMTDPGGLEPLGHGRYLQWWGGISRNCITADWNSIVITNHESCRDDHRHLGTDYGAGIVTFCDTHGATHVGATIYSANGGRYDFDTETVDAHNNYIAFLHHIGRGNSPVPNDYWGTVNHTGRIGVGVYPADTHFVRVVNLICKP